MRDYHTQMEAAKKGILTPQMEIVAKKENMSADELIRRVAAGTIAIHPCRLRALVTDCAPKLTSTSGYRGTASTTPRR